MTAREMFEGIGYKLSEAYNEETLISYFDGKKNITIEFYIKNKQFKKAKGVFDCVAIKESELKAIIQQCKELGWLEKEKKPVYKLTKFENDLLQSYVEGNLRKCMFKDISALMRIKEKGYFKGVDENARIEDILTNCEVIKDVNG